MRDVSAVRHRCMRVSIQVPDALREELGGSRWKGDGQCRLADVNLGMCLPCCWCCCWQRACRVDGLGVAHHRLAVDLATGLPTRQVLEAEFDELRCEGDGWLFALMSPGLRDYRQHVVPGAQALFREQLPALRESLPRVPALRE
ncbi:hypothetical protein DSL92_07865 [Billgrantia gudaonensis]|uniref:Uncharacterized protein n=1 Tax=Billgrantia gudaonensis TaxID=376427 RepID=A0A432JGY4_9GAMM|nr:hypothetical protein DSL92_07865 [Halomonas gudaonensis]